MTRTDYEKKIFEILKLSGHSDISYLNVKESEEGGDYIVYYADVSNVPLIYGDGKVLKRQSSCEILVVEEGTGNSKNSGKVLADVCSALEKMNISYTTFCNGYNLDTSTVQTTIDFYL